MPANKFYEGLEVVVYIALNSGAGPVSSKEIAKNQQVLPRHLESVMQLLANSGIIKGTKGPKGGYTLAKEKRKITAGDVYKCFSGGGVKSESFESPLKKTVIRPLYKQVKSSIMKELGGVTIEGLCENVPVKRNPPALPGGFEI